jgi:hypothetical protein
MKKVHIVVEITVDEDNIEKMYPNFSVNWEDADEFISYLTDDLETEYDVNGKLTNNLKEFGFSKRVLTRDEAKLIDIDNY